MYCLLAHCQSSLIGGKKKKGKSGRVEGERKSVLQTVKMQDHVNSHQPEKKRKKGRRGKKGRGNCR